MIKLIRNETKQLIYHVSRPYSHTEQKIMNYIKQKKEIIVER